MSDNRLGPILDECRFDTGVWRDIIDKQIERARYIFSITLAIIAIFISSYHFISDFKIYGFLLAAIILVYSLVISNGYLAIEKPRDRDYVPQRESLLKLMKNQNTNEIQETLILTYANDDELMDKLKQEMETDREIIKLMFRRFLELLCIAVLIGVTIINNNYLEEEFVTGINVTIGLILIIIIIIEIIISNRTEGDDITDENTKPKKKPKPLPLTPIQKAAKKKQPKGFAY